MAKKYTYSDINMSMLKHPVSYDIAKRFDMDAIKGSIRSILKTRRGEKLFNPEFGGDIDTLLFELITPATKLMANRLITEEIQRWEPRVLIRTVSIDTEPDYMGQIEITIEFVIKENTNVADSVTIRLERIR